MTTKDIATQYVSLCKEHKNDTILSELFSKDAVSVEAAAPPGGSAESKGIEAIRGKGKWWVENHTVHEAKIDGPFPSGDRFCVRFSYDITFKPDGSRRKMDEVGLFTVADGKIVREEFFYTT